MAQFAGANRDDIFHAAVLEHAKFLGMDPVAHAEFLWLAEEALVAPMPAGWTACEDEASKAVYYYNEHTGESRWDNPLDEQYRAMFTNLLAQQAAALAYVPIAIVAAVDDGVTFGMRQKSIFAPSNITC